MNALDQEAWQDAVSRNGSMLCQWNRRSGWAASSASDDTSTNPWTSYQYNSGADEASRLAGAEIATAGRAVEPALARVEI